MKHPDSWSYSFNDEVGALDHLLVSPSLKHKVVDATDWHINGAESTLFDYNDEFKGNLPNRRINSAPQIMTQRYWSLTSTVVH